MLVSLHVNPFLLFLTDIQTGDTPRRSARLSAKLKAMETPEGEKPKKRERTSSGRKVAQAKKESEGEKASEAAEGTTAANEVKAAADAEMKDAEGNVDETKECVQAEEAQQESVEKTNQNIGEKAVEHPKNETTQKVGQPDHVAPDEEQKEAENGNQEKVNSEMLPLTSEGKEDEHAEEKEEDSDMLPPAPASDANAEKVLQSFEPPKVDAPAENEAVGGVAPAAENDSRKETPHTLNLDDGHCQPKASPVNC